MNAAMDVASGASPARFALIAEQARTSRFADVMNFPQAAMTATWGIVRRHGGHIDVRSEPGRGSTFTLTFPTAEANA